MSDPALLQIVPRNRFDRELRRMERRNKDLSKLRAVVAMLAHRQPLLRRHCDHLLTGNWKGCRECHIEPDWLLIYKIEDNILKLERTGSHSDLFG